MSVNKEIRKEAEEVETFEKKNGLIVIETSEVCDYHMGGWNAYSVMYNPNTVPKEAVENYIKRYQEAQEKGIDFNAIASSKEYDIICLPKNVMNNFRRMIKEQYDMIPKVKEEPQKDTRNLSDLERLVSAFSDNTILSNTQAENLACAIEAYVKERIATALDKHLYAFDHTYDNHGMD